MLLFMAEWYRTDHHEKGIRFHSLWTSSDNAEKAIAPINANYESDSTETARLRVVPVTTGD
jgi:hypothetical protein